jgi:hypothetical protein
VNDQSLDPTLSRRLRRLRMVAIVVPWLTLAAFGAMSIGPGGGGPYAMGFPDDDRRLLTGMLLGSGALSILAWITVRRSTSATAHGVATTVCYVAAIWVAVLGAAASGRGASFVWFVVCYVWTMAVVWGLFPLDRT